MGHFTIDLPNNLHADVRWGTVRKVAFNLNFFSKKKQTNQQKTGYIVKVGSQQEYRLFKSKDGKWSVDVDGQKELGPGIYQTIKDAIIAKETNSN